MTFERKYDDSGRICGRCQKYKIWDYYNISNGVHGRRTTCIPCAAAHNKEWRKTNGAKQNAKRVEWYNRNKERKLAANAAYWRNNPALLRAKKARRRASKLSRTPAWGQDNIVQVYEEARRKTEKTGKLWTVDHIIPLQGEYVSGLHVYDNLQVMLGSENFSKGANYDR